MDSLNLFKYIESVRDREFEWGQFDCTLFPATCLDVMRDTNAADVFRQQWGDEQSALEYSRQSSITLESWLVDQGCSDVDQSLIQSGDFVMTELVAGDSAGWRTAGVYVGNGRAAICVAGGLAFARVANLNPVRVLRYTPCHKS